MISFVYDKNGITYVGKEFTELCRLVTENKGKLHLLENSTILSFLYHRKEYMNQKEIWYQYGVNEILNIVLKYTGKHIFLDDNHIVQSLRLKIKIRDETGKKVRLGFIIGITDSYIPISLNHYVYLTDKGLKDECLHFSLIFERKFPFTEHDVIKIK